MNIYQKINEVMKEIEYLTKDDKVEYGNTKYKAISEEKVTTAVREQLVKQGIVIIPIQQESSIKELIRTDKNVNMLTSVHVKYRIQNIDDVNDFIEVESNGTGVDTQDKGVGKAMTYAYKYMLLRTFAIPTGEDPDKTSSAETDAKIAKELQNKKTTTKKPTVSKVTEVEAKAAYALMIRKGSTDVVKDLQHNYGVSNTKDLTKQQYIHLVQSLNKLPDKNSEQRKKEIEQEQGDMYEAYESANWDMGARG